MIGRILRWIWDYWYIPLILVLVILGWILSRKWMAPDSGKMMEAVNHQLQASKAKNEARNWQAEYGAQVATEKVLAQHVEKVEALDNVQKIERRRLESDPVALANFLERASR